MPNYGANTSAPRSSDYTGGFENNVNSRLDYYYRGTREASLDASGLTVVCGMTVTAGGLTVTAGGATITAGGLTVTAGDMALTAGNFLVGSCGDLQILNAAGTDIFLAVACSEPSAAKGTVWVWAGSCAATAPAGSGFLMIVDDGCA